MGGLGRLHHAAGAPGRRALAAQAGGAAASAPPPSEIVATSGRYEAGAAEQAGALNETSATTEELARSARQIAENARRRWRRSPRARSRPARRGQESAEAFAGSMEPHGHDNQAIADGGRPS